MLALLIVASAGGGHVLAFVTESVVAILGWFDRAVGEELTVCTVLAGENGLDSVFIYGVTLERGMILDAAEHGSAILGDIEVGQVHLSLLGGLAAGDGGRQDHSLLACFQYVFPAGISRVGKEFFGLTPQFIQALDYRNHILLIACMGTFQCNIGDDLKGIFLLAGFGEGCFIALPLVAIGGIGVGRILERVGRNLPGCFEGDLSGFGRIHAALFFKNASHKAVGFHLRDLGVIPEPVHEIEHMHRALVEPPPGFRRFCVGKIARSLSVDFFVEGRQFLVKLGKILHQPVQESFYGPHEEFQSGKVGHVGDDACGIEALLADGKPRFVNDLAGHLLEDLPCFSVESQKGAEIVERLLANVSLEYINIEGVVPPQIEFQRSEHLPVGELVHLLQNANPCQKSHGHIGPAVISAIEAAERLLVDHGEYGMPKGTGPRRFQGGNSFGGKIHIVVKDGFLLPFVPEHGMASCGDI